MHNDYSQARPARAVFAGSALALAVALALSAPQAAHASAFQLNENSAQSMGRAYAGGGAAPNDVLPHTLLALKQQPLAPA